jgi:hypothetical protein
MEFFLEVVVFGTCVIFAAIRLVKWLTYTSDSQSGRIFKLVLGFLPAVCLVMVFITLTTMASFDVVDSFLYIFCYMAMGMVWLVFGMYLLFKFFDVSWIDDALNMSNKAALVTVVAFGLAFTLIYAGANIGDGPGWWCVVFAGGAGISLYVFFVFLADKITGMFERITIDRDVSCGLRTGGYLIAAGIILARASAGDWTSFSMTIFEFWTGWPVLILTPLAVFVEFSYVKLARTNLENGEYKEYRGSSLLWGLGYIAGAIAVIFLALPPLI